MASVAKHMPTFVYDPGVGSFKCWLLNMTRWRITDHFRKRISTAQPFGSDAQTPISETSLIERLPDPSTMDLDAVWEREWQANLLEAAKAKVRVRTDPEKFQIFDLYVRNEAAPDKIARLYGITIGQVYVIKHRVAEAIKTEVRRLEHDAF
jgi:RNA polymerase sigma-70 factor (ECF subfamily)